MNKIYKPDLKEKKKKEEGKRKGKKGGGADPNSTWTDIDALEHYDQ